jgi:hypothetical protein
VGFGTIVRLSADSLILLLGLWLGTFSGTAVAGAAVALGVTSEAIYTGIRVRPVLRDQLRPQPPVEPPISLRFFLDFYTPLALTSLLTLVIQPMGSAALSRMPHALASLAAWPVVSGLVFMLRSLGVAYNEVVVALLDRPRAYASLRRFAVILVSFTSGMLVLTAATPLAGVWFRSISALSPDLAILAQRAVWFALPLPALSVLQSWYQGLLLHGRQTRTISQSVVLFLVITGLLLVLGVAWNRAPGLYVAWGAFVIGSLIQMIYLAWRSRPLMAALLATEGPQSLPVL